jgi:hypothetical protein
MIILLAKSAIIDRPILADHGGSNWFTLRLVVSNGVS